MKEVYVVEIFCRNNENNKTYQYNTDCQSLVDVARLMLTYKPKRGYHITSVYTTLKNVLF